MFLNLLLTFILSITTTPPIDLTNNGLIKGEYIQQNKVESLSTMALRNHEAEPVIEFPYKIDPNNLGPIINSESAVVIDEETGKILFEKNANQKRPIASITKLAVILTYFHTGADWNQIITILPQDRQPGGKRNLYPNERIKAKELVYLSLVGSDNDAISALVRSSGFLETEFVQKINQELKISGLLNTNIYEPTGLSPDNVSTALEVAKLARQAFREPSIQKAGSLQVFTFSPENSNIKRKVYNTNQLLNNDLVKITAGKTGSTEAAKYSLVVAAENEQGKKIIVALLGASTDNLRFQETKKLIWWTFENYEWGK